MEINPDCELVEIVYLCPFKITILLKLHDLEFEPFISEAEIINAIDGISERLNAEFRTENPVFLGVLNGSFMFASEIIKRFKGNCEVNFVKLGSYQGTQSAGEVKTLLGLNQELKGRIVIVLEDIVDTGNTLVALDRILENAEVKEYKVVTLFFKPEAYKKKIQVGYIGLEIPNEFIVGFGLDYDGLGRNLTQVYKRKID